MKNNKINIKKRPKNKKIYNLTIDELEEIYIFLNKDTSNFQLDIMWKGVKQVLKETFPENQTKRKSIELKILYAMKDNLNDFEKEYKKIIKNKLLNFKRK